MNESYQKKHSLPMVWSCAKSKYKLKRDKFKSQLFVYFFVVVSVRKNQSKFLDTADRIVCQDKLIFTHWHGKKIALNLASEIKNTLFDKTIMYMPSN